MWACFVGTPRPAMSNANALRKIGVVMAKFSVVDPTSPNKQLFMLFIPAFQEFVGPNEDDLIKNMILHIRNIARAYPDESLEMFYNWADPRAFPSLDVYLNTLRVVRNHQVVERFPNVHIDVFV